MLLRLLCDNLVVCWQEWRNGVPDGELVPRFRAWFGPRVSS